ncbi:thiamine pyrophosphate-binding protein [Dankookia rubra]|uniref:Thiamine pyrophosphate-binding protein n=1 Tax=Dankookia rubra TaxID=1442381 RepID=A0A4R5Q7M8_9PROT|nr:thiamine pyrophosphate-dependent enzyme [Dankookia rubra]TDH58914.1 thiamine pyrophosphate-binding protein [Dankookia rubra]
MNEIGSSPLDRTTLASDAAPGLTVAEALARALQALGVRQAYGVSGGAQALLWAALSRHLDLLHCRHESGAAFAATEAHFASGRPVVAFATTGPGITNALTGMLAARTEGAKVILLSAYGSAAQRGRGAIQETSGYTMPTSGLFEAGAWFDDAVVLETPDQLPQVLRRLAAGLARPGGYVAHLSVPTTVQGALLTQPMPPLPPEAPSPSVTGPAAIARCVALLSGAPFAIWAGFGARGAAAAVQALAERTGAPVMCSPRAKGVIPEDHPLFLGVTGMGGHAASVIARLRDLAPRRILVLGTRLGEPTSFWSPALVPPGGFVHVDIDPRVPGAAYPQAETYSVQAEVGEFLGALLAAWPEQDLAGQYSLRSGRPHPAHPAVQPSARLRPEALMGAVQRVVLDGSDATVLAESGNAFTWATHYLRLPGPGRYRVSTNLGSMGHVAAGVVGAALGAGRKAVAILGDGAMLMNSGEVSTAVKRQAPAVWIVLNDGRYNMCHQGMAALGMAGAADALFPPTDFAMLARAMGAEGLRVGDETALDAALAEAMAAPGPVVIDALIDADRPAPSHGRNEGLGAATAAARAAVTASVSFPVIASH